MYAKFLKGETELKLTIERYAKFLKGEAGIQCKGLHFALKICSALRSQALEDIVNTDFTFEPKSTTLLGQLDITLN